METRKEPTFQEMEKLADSIDNFFSAGCIANGLDPLSFTAIIMARFIRIATELGYADKQIELFQKVIQVHKENIQPTNSLMH